MKYMKRFDSFGRFDYNTAQDDYKHSYDLLDRLETLHIIMDLAKTGNYFRIMQVLKFGGFDKFITHIDDLQNQLIYG